MARRTGKEGNGIIKCNSKDKKHIRVGEREREQVKPEVDVKCLPQSVSTLVFETCLSLSLESSAG